MDEKYYLEFEKPIIALDRRISQLKDRISAGDTELEQEINNLEKKRTKLQVDVYSKLNRWQRVQLARHPLRPYSLDLVKLVFDDFIELHGDRYFSDDKAMIGGFAVLNNKPVIFVGQQKGRDVKQRQYRNFGMSHPEGYRKALRLFKMAEKFELPIVIFIDTPGAFPGIAAEERGQAEAIARNIREMSVIETPIIVIIIGEGASGGALGIGVGDTVMMLENSWYSVISPEGCSAILWKQSDDPKTTEMNRMQAAESLKPTSSDLMELGIVDDIIPEPVGGAHRDYSVTAANIKQKLIENISNLSEKDKQTLLADRLRKYRSIGVFKEI